MEEIEFFYRGMPAGTFPGDAKPERDGKYAYRPMKGHGHAELLAALGKSGVARCYYDTILGRQLFDVLGVPDQGKIETGNFFLSRLPDSNLVPWLEPWVPATTGLEKELERELGVGHVLFGKPCRAVARRIDKDEVLFQVKGGTHAFAVVRLARSRQPGTDPAFPETEVYSSMDEWVEKRMKPDHEEFMGP